MDSEMRNEKRGGTAIQHTANAASELRESGIGCSEIDGMDNWESINRYRCDGMDEGGQRGTWGGGGRR
jgi:hypothetical protein